MFTGWHAVYTAYARSEMPLTPDTLIYDDSRSADFISGQLERPVDAYALRRARVGLLAALPLSDLRVLIVENDPSLAQALGRLYSMHGLQVRAAMHADAGLLICQSWRPHLVVTDHALATWSGIELCRRVRATSSAALIVVSKHDEEAVKIAALDAGADDYLTKPYSVTELMARSRAVLRRASDEGTETPLQVGIFRIDFDRRRTYVHDQEVKLTPKAFDLLVYFARHPNRVIERSCLLKAVWCEDAADHPEYLRAYIGQIRKRIEPEPSKPRYLLTESWVGYRFHPFDEATTAN
jgi:two-component system, OmpR family, KDP operon response regulator KdpE